MDEVENLPMEIQQMLLRAIEERRYRPVGAGQDRRVDVRIIVATNEDLQQAVVERRFRKDLLFRFQDFTLVVPSLHDCLEDILPLADFFRRQSCAQLRKEVEDFDEMAKKILLEYDWSGNVRELKQVVQASVLICEGKVITPQYLQLKRPRKRIHNVADEEKVNKYLQKDEKSHTEQIRQAISASKGNLTQAAVLLGISRPTLYKKMNLYGITK